MSVEAKLSKISLNLHTASPAGSKHTTLKETPDSWEDVEEDEPVEAPGPTLKQIVSNDNPAPPPTPISPSQQREKRPEKTTATANRLIAGALGIKAPKKTEEQKQYDRAMKEAEIKRKNKEQETLQKQKMADEQAKSAVWDD